MGSLANLTIIDHPLIQHKVGHLRRKATPTKLFKELVNEISTLMAFEVTRSLPLEDVGVETPLEETVARRIQGKKLVVVPILRAGLGMVEGILHLIVRSSWWIPCWRRAAQRQPRWRC
jgi:uracil phosphoribosyltransferase